MLVTSYIVHIFVALFICFRISFVCLLNDFTEVYSYLLMAVYYLHVWHSNKYKMLGFLKCLMQVFNT